MNFRKTWICSEVYNALEPHIMKQTIWSLLRSPTIAQPHLVAIRKNATLVGSYVQ